MIRTRKVWHIGAGLALSVGSVVAVAVVLAGSLGGAACAPVPPEPAAAQPFNACPQHSCDLFAEPAGLTATCACIAFERSATGSPLASCAESKACINKSTPNVFLQVDLPGDSAFAPGLTFFIMNPEANSAAFVKARPTACVDPNTNLTCIQLPLATPLRGELLASYDMTQTVGFNLGNGPGSETTLPVTATIAPFLSFGMPPTLVDARDAGVLAPAPLLSQIDPTSPQYSGNAQGVGPYGGMATAFYTPLAVGTYAVTLQPGAPFDAYFPPYTMSPPPSVPANADFLSIDLTVDPPATRTTNVRSAAALDGMVAYLRNAAGVRISTRVPLHGQDATTGIPLQLQTSGQPANLAGDFFVIAPANELAPGGRATFFNTALSITTGGLGAEQTYPQLPAPVSVAGQVFATGLVPTAADVYLTSTGIDRVDQSAPDDTSLSYATSFATDACGNYSVMLPPGTYSARVAPRENGQMCGQTSAIAPAQTVTTLDVATTPAAQNGKSLQLEDGIPVSGTCRVADGRALALATVVLTASTSLASNPGTVPAPRTFTTVTRNDGTFSVPVDPGVYDVSVQPATGSNLPWVVAARQTVVAPSFALADQVVPAPIPRSYTVFQQPDGITVPNARVTAYSAPLAAADAGLGTIAVVPVAQGITDAYGNVNLLFSVAAP